MKKIILDSDPDRQSFFEFVEQQKSKRSQRPEVKENIVEINRFEFNILMQKISQLENNISNFSMIVKDIVAETKKEIIKQNDELLKSDFYIQNTVKSLQNDLSNYVLNKVILKISKLIESEVRVQIANSDLHKQSHKLIVEHVKIELKNIIEMVIHEHINYILKKYTREMRIAKDLIYSADAEIKHYFMKSDYSLEGEEMIKSKLDEFFTKISKEHLALKHDEVHE